MGKILDKRATPLLINELKNEDIRVVESAIVALCNIKPFEALEPLKELLVQDNWELKVYAKEAIRMIEKNLSKDY